MTQSPTPETNHTPVGLVRLSAAARLANISVEMLEAGVANGSIPVAIIQPGRRVRYVLAAELGAWLHGRSKQSLPSLENPQ